LNLTREERILRVELKYLCDEKEKLGGIREDEKVGRGKGRTSSATSEDFKLGRKKVGSTVV
jgi:hypothetical protein